MPEKTNDYSEDYDYNINSGNENKNSLADEISMNEAESVTEENIPKMSEEEKVQLKAKRNSPEFQQELQQILPKSKEQGKEGIGNLDQLIQQWKSETSPVGEEQNTTGIPDKLKMKIEQLSGLDLSSVKVHYNSEKPKEVGAYAYTKGSDIFIAPNQESHLPEETWHVVQQMQGKVKPTTEVDGVNINDNSTLENEAVTMGNSSENGVNENEGTLQKKSINGSPVVQRAEWVEKNGTYLWNELINGVTWFSTSPDEVWFNITDANLVPDGYLTDYQHFEGQKKTFEEWHKMDLNSALEEVSNEETSSDDNSTKVIKSIFGDGVDKLTSVPGALIGNDGVSGLADAWNDKTVLTNSGGGENAKNQVDARNMGITADSLTGISGIIGFVKGFKDATNPELSADKQFEAFLNYEQGAMKIGESVSKLTATATQDDTAAKFGSTFEGFSAGFGFIKDSFLAVKGAVELIKGNEDLSSEEKIKKAGKTSLSALEAAKSAVLSVKSFYELATGSASGSLMAAVPGADIAISALKISMQGYYAVQSHHSCIEMAKQQTISQGAAAKENDVSENQISNASEFYKRNDALIANKYALIKEDEEVIEEINKNPNPSSKDNKRKTKRESRIEQLKRDIAELETNTFVDNDKEVSKESVSEYTLVTELKDINDKRVKRQTIHVVTEMAKIAGSIATLTGVGSAAGGIIKGSAAAVDMALPAARMAKQAGRNNAAREEAKKKPGESHSSMFNTSKSDAAKQDFRLQQVKTIIRMAIDAKPADPNNPADPAYEKIKKFMNATGVNSDKLLKEQDKSKQIKLLIEALSEREFI